MLEERTFWHIVCSGVNPSPAFSFLPVSVLGGAELVTMALSRGVGERIACKFTFRLSFYWSDSLEVILMSKADLSDVSYKRLFNIINLSQYNYHLWFSSLSIYVLLLHCLLK